MLAGDNTAAARNIAKIQNRYEMLLPAVAHPPKAEVVHPVA
jgi:hypothetical protein